MTDEAIVLSHFPNAKAQRRQEMLQLGRASATQPSSWKIFDQPGLGAAEIGRGTTRAEAWAEAAKPLKGDVTELDSNVDD
jgi:hypothetical protein